jgi:hypothetical protein
MKSLGISLPVPREPGAGISPLCAVDSLTLRVAAAKLITERLILSIERSCLYKVNVFNI